MSGLTVIFVGHIYSTV